MPLSVMRNVYLRPTRSPTRPNTKAPKGRIRNPAVNVPTVLMSALPEAPAAKNFTDRSAAKLPKM